MADLKTLTNLLPDVNLLRVIMKTSTDILVTNTEWAPVAATEPHSSIPIVK